ncbi:MAG: DMT family transporter, partial [Bacteroidales bacterium]|nr:DMT family transporter [Bacteroidales bacterium]
AAALAQMENIVPFAANFIRCITGFVFFFIAILIGRDFAGFTSSVKDRKGMTAMLIAVIFGPFVGVGLSLMAVQYTAAGIASTLMALTPIIIILPSYWLFKTPITLKGILGAVISCIGVALFFI